MVDIKSVLSKLITASHILHYHEICDAYGHISVRNPTNAATFFMPRNLAPALVSSAGDIVEYNVSNAEPLDPNAPRGYIERNIHAGIYRQYSNISSVVHAHAQAVVAFSILPEGTFRPIYHMAGFIGPKSPIFDIASHYSPSDQQDLLIRTTSQGDALSSSFSSPASNVPKPNPDFSVVLMRGHGFTVVTNSIESAVFQASYTLSNAEILSKALASSGGLGVATLLTQGSGGGVSTPGVKYLTAQEAEDTWKGNSQTIDRPWDLWQAEVEREGALYVNNLK